MKRTYKQFNKTGLCAICGKSTKLLIHQPCGAKMDAAKKAKKTSKKGNYEFSEQQKQTAAHNAVKKRYASGYVPKFCFT